MLLPALFLLVQSSSFSGASFTGRIVSEETGEPVAGATVTPAEDWGGLPVALTDEAGRFAFEVPVDREPIRGKQRRYLHGDEVYVTAPGFAPVTVDTTARAPWADTIPLRTTTRLTGVIRGARKWEDVSVRAEPEHLTWPPQTGLAWLAKPFRAPIDAEGRFELEGVPTHVPLTLLLGTDSFGWSGLQLGDELVLVAGETKHVEFERPPDPQRPDPIEPVDPAWQRISALALDETGRPKPTAWFELVPPGRHVSHARIGGGRWHVHGNRPCNCLESLPGKRSIVARNPDGWIGIRRFDVEPGPNPARPRVTIHPGGLLRLHLAGEAARSRVVLRSNGLEFASRSVLGDTIWYELALAGEVELVVTVADSAPVVHTLRVEPGATIRFEIPGG